MKKIVVIIVAVLVCGLAITNCNNPTSHPSNTDSSADLIRCPAQPAGYTPFPQGFNYPLDESVINRWVANQQMDSIRMHAWNLWAGINQTAPNGKLIWQTWLPVSNTFEITGGGGSVSALKHLKSMSHKTEAMKAATPGNNQFCVNFPQYPNSNDTDYGFLANNGDIMIAGEYFNYEAYCHIRSNRLYSAGKLKTFLQDPNKAPGGQIPQFPKGSIILKHMYWPVKQSGFSALPVWDNKPVCGNEEYNGYETWPRLVAIDPTNQSTQKTAVVNYLHIPGYNSITSTGNVVPISSFYSWQIDATTWNALALNDKRIIDSSFVWAYGRHFQPGDYLVSIAMHIITKEIYDWAMQSIWWHDTLYADYYSKNKPTNLPKGAWQNYRVTTAYNMVTPKEPDGSPLVAYNPYIELVVPEKNRIVSNCQNCHARAAYPSSGIIFDPIGQNPVISGKDSARYNATQRGLIKPSDLIFKGLVTTDFSWVITDRAH